MRVRNEGTHMVDAKEEQPEDNEEAEAPSEEPIGKKPKKKRSLGFKIGVVAIIAVVAFVALYGGVIAYMTAYNSTESEKRTAWAVETGDLTGTNGTYDVDIYDANVESDLAVLQIEPAEVEDEDFTYYDEDVQARLAGTVEVLQAGQDWTAAAPLAILNPYGTGSNGLYLYFNTDAATEVSYLIETEGCDDFSATASDGCVTEHELQVIGLVPGAENHVTLTLTDEQGVATETVEFDITMPETQSGYATQLEYTEGESTQELSNGLYVMLRCNGYLGYGFFFDNEGTLRYEMVTEGLGLDRIVEYDGDIVVCASDCKIARIDALGRVVKVYDLEGEYVLHHDINYSYEDSKLLVAVEHAESDENLIEDTVIELDLETGEYEELIDFSEFMSDFREECTRVVGVTDPFLYEVGWWDWFHMNTVQYVEDDDSIIVSSRETSAIIKVENIHTDPEIAWICGNPDVWEGTAYEDLCLNAVGDFKYQYGQHTVEYAGAGDEDGVYYLRLFDNNYWGISTRDDAELDEEDAEGVVTSSLNVNEDARSYVYVYKIDENEGTFELVLSFDVPYSSVVCSASPSDVWTSYNLDTQDEAYDMTGKNWIVNSGTALTFGEYDEDGTLIREFYYDADFQAYRVIKYTFEGFWFAE